MPTLTAVQVATLAYGAGWRGNDVAIATAVAKRESGFNTHSHNPVPPDDSYGLWQINMIGKLGPDRRQREGLTNNAQLFDPAINARVAFNIFKAGGWAPWSTHKNGAYLAALPEAREAAKQVIAANGAPAGVELLSATVPAGAGDAAAAALLGPVGSAVLGNSGPLDALGGLVAPFGAIADFFRFVTDLDNIKRAAMIVAGVGILGIGLAIIFRDTFAGAAKLAAKVGAGVATGGASTAAGAAASAAT